MKFCWCTLHVRDIEESIRFYTEIVGLAVRRRHGVPGGPQIVFLGGEGSEVELIAGGEPADMGKDISLGFAVDSVEEKMAFVKERGIAIDSGPFQPNPNVRFFFVCDPDGLKIQFVESVE
jgi:lactoylglutathione lyase